MNPIHRIRLAAEEARLARIQASRWLENRRTPPAVWDDPAITGKREEVMQHGISIDYAGMSPEMKLQILKEMGFKEIPPPEHGTNCTSRQGRGLVCDCLMGVTTWGAPVDVKKWLGETHEERAEFAAKRWAYLNDGEGESPGSWGVHLTENAPRYRQ